MTSDTPRTDAAWKAAFRGTYIDAESIRDFAQILEREGNAASAEIEAMQVAIQEVTPLLDKVHCELGATNEHLINRIAEGEAVTTWQRDVEESLITLRAALAKLQPFITPGA